MPAVAILALALGIGANTAIFSVVNNVLLGRLPVKDPGSLIVFTHYNEQRKLGSRNTPYADICEWRRQFQSFEGIAAISHNAASLAEGGQPERVRIGKATANFFPLLGVRPALGRDFLPAEDRPGGHAVAILSDELWRRRYGASANAIGALATLDGVAHTVVAVLPPGFRFVGEKTDIYVPLAGREARGQGMTVAVAYGRLKSGVAREKAQSELDVATAATVARLPVYRGWRLTMGGLSEYIVPDVKLSLWVLQGAVGLVLLIACANIASLLLSKAAARRREMAVRAALGAGRGRLMSQLMAESLPIAILGGAFGLVLAVLLVKLLPGFDLSRIPRLGDTRIDFTVLAFTAGVSVLTCILFGLAPALSASRTDVSEALKEGGRSASGSIRGRHLRSVMVVAEVALALLLSIGATLMIRSFYRLSNVNPGLNATGVLTATMDVPRAKFQSPEQLSGYYVRVAEGIQATAGVQSVSLMNSLPLGGNYFRGDFPIESREPAKPGEATPIDFRVVDENYLRTMQIPLVRGRFFTSRDRMGSPLVMLINESTSRRYFPDSDPIGRRMGTADQRLTIVGIVADVRHTDVSMEPGTELLLPFGQMPGVSVVLAVRLDSSLYPDPERFAPLLRRAVAAVDKDQALGRVMSMERVMSDRLAPRRLSVILLVLFATLALALAAIGIYGVLSFAMEQRTHEIGVRIAMGAEHGDVIGMVVREAMLLSIAGLLIGAAGALGLTRFMGTLLYEVSAADPWIFSCTAAILCGLSLAASYLPARRAARVDPIVALRYE